MSIYLCTVPKAIRNAYEEVGVTAYYQQEGGRYKNPHFPQIRELLIQNAHRIDYRNAFDFCCGSGEVSQVINALGYPLPMASDPYTGEAYFGNFQKKCLSISFQEVIQGKLNEQFSSVICSFAMHLCPPKKLFPLVFQLFCCTPQLVIITPHKRPDLEQLDGVQLEFEDFALTERGKKVRLKSYRFKHSKVD